MDRIAPPGLGFFGLLSALGRHLADAMVYIDVGRRVLRVAPGVVERAGQLALSGLAGLKGSEVQVAEQHLAIALLLTDGTRVKLRLVPRDVAIEGYEFRFRARVPGGLLTSHTQQWMAAVVSVIDGIFRLSEQQTNSIPGLRLEGEELEYRRTFAPAGSESWLVPLVEFVQGIGWPTRFPVAIRDGWLELEVLPRKASSI